MLASGCTNASAVPAVSAPSQEPPATFVRGDRSYRLSWHESFDRGLGPAELGDWTFAGNAARFTPKNVRAEEGKLELRLTRSEPPVQERAFSGAEYDRHEEQLFGRCVARMRPHAPPGVIASFFTAL